MMKIFILITLCVLVLAVPCQAARDLKEDTAVTIIVGPLLDDGDGKTAEDAITVADTVIYAFKGAATATQITPITSSGGNNDFTHVTQGYYSLELTATDTSTAGYLRITFNYTGVLPFYEDFNVLEPNIYDSKYSSDGVLLSSSEPATASIAAIYVDTNEMQGKLPTNYIMGSSVQTDKDDEIDAILLDTGTDGVLISAADPVASSVAAILVDTAEVQGKLPTNYIMGSSVQTDKDDEIDAILVDTNEIQGKLPTNYIMGSSDQTDQDDDLDAINALAQANNNSLTNVEADTNELQGDWVDTGRLDAILDTINTYVQANNASLTNVEADTNELQGDWVDTGRLDAILDTVNTYVQANNASLTNVEADTNELQGDWVDTGRLDSLLDTAAAGSNLLTYLEAIVADTDILQTEWADTGRLDNLLDTAASGSSPLTYLEAIVADTDILQSEWADSGRLDNLLDTAASGSNPFSYLEAILADTGTDGVLIAPGDAVPVSIALILADTDILQSEWADSGRLDNLLDTAASGSSPYTYLEAILADTGTDGVLIAPAEPLVTTVNTINSYVQANNSGIGTTLSYATANNAALTTVVANVADILTDTSAMDTATELRTLITGGDAPALSITSAGVISDTIWDETMSDHTTSGSFGVHIRRIR